MVKVMTKIVIKDLPESIELDRQAMGLVVGGSRSSSRQGAYIGALKNKKKTLWADLIRTKRQMQL